MKALADRRARVARVRRVQHLQAVSAAAVAEGRLLHLQGNADRLAAMRASLAQDLGTTSGAALGSIGELAVRLDAARVGLGTAIDSAQQVVDLRAAERLGAHIAREGAERLQDRAVAALQDLIEERMAASFVARSPKGSRDG